jgi:hypothetical protein
LLVVCPTLEETRSKLRLKIIDSSSISATAKHLITESFQSVKKTTQMMLDCSTVPSVISAKQIEGPSLLEQLYRISRGWCFSLHKTRLKLLGRWKI